MIESIAGVKRAVEQAEREIYRVNACVNDMALLIRGKLRSSRVPDSTLKILKEELRDYNIHTGRWK